MSLSPALFPFMPMVKPESLKFGRPPFIDCLPSIFIPGMAIEDFLGGLLYMLGNELLDMEYEGDRDFEGDIDLLGL